MKTTRPKWLFVLPSILFVLASLSYFSSRERSLGFVYLSLSFLWGVVMRIAYLKQNKL